MSSFEEPTVCSAESVQLLNSILTPESTAYHTNMLNEFNARIKSYIDAEEFVRQQHVLFPTVCAKYGWKCNANILLICETCLAMLSTSLPDADDPLFKEHLERILECLKTAHKKNCPWLLLPCPDDYVRIYPMRKEEAFQKFSARLKLLYSLEEQLPCIADKIAEVLGLADDVCSSLCKISYLSEKCFSKSAVLLAATGWTKDLEKEQRKYLKCQMCQRSVALSTFTSLSSCKRLKLEQQHNNQIEYAEDFERNDKSLDLKRTEDLKDSNLNTSQQGRIHVTNEPTSAAVNKTLNEDVPDKVCESHERLQGKTNISNKCVQNNTDISSVAISHEIDISNVAPSCDVGTLKAEPTKFDVPDKNDLPNEGSINETATANERFHCGIVVSEETLMESEYMQDIIDCLNDPSNENSIPNERAFAEVSIQNDCTSNETAASSKYFLNEADIQNSCFSDFSIKTEDFHCDSTSLNIPLYSEAYSPTGSLSFDFCMSSNDQSCNIDIMSESTPERTEISNADFVCKIAQNESQRCEVKTANGKQRCEDSTLVEDKYCEQLADIVNTIEDETFEYSVEDEILRKANEGRPCEKPVERQPSNVNDPVKSESCKISNPTESQLCEVSSPAENQPCEINRQTIDLLSEVIAKVVKVCEIEISNEKHLFKIGNLSKDLLKVSTPDKSQCGEVIFANEELPGVVLNKSQLCDESNVSNGKPCNADVSNKHRHCEITVLNQNHCCQNDTPSKGLLTETDNPNVCCSPEIDISGDYIPGEVNLSGECLFHESSCSDDDRRQSFERPNQDVRMKPDSNLKLLRPLNRKRKLFVQCFDPLYNHRSWCPWLVESGCNTRIHDNSAKDASGIPGWQLFIRCLLRNIEEQEEEQQQQEEEEQEEVCGDLSTENTSLNNEIYNAKCMLDTWSVHD